MNTGDTKDMDEEAILNMMETYLIKARLNFSGQRKEAIKRIKQLCEGLLR